MLRSREARTLSRLETEGHDRNRLAVLLGHDREEHPVSPSSFRAFGSSSVYVSGSSVAQAIVDNGMRQVTIERFGETNWQTADQALQAKERCSVSPP